MASLSDLMNSGEEETNSTANTAERPRRFSRVVGTTPVADGTPGTHTEDGKIILESPNKRATASTRQALDLSKLETRKEQVLDIKKDLESDILEGENSPLSRYLDKKVEEYKDACEKIDAYNERLAIERGEEVPSDEELQKIGSEDLTPALGRTVLEEDMDPEVKRQMDEYEANKKTVSISDAFKEEDTDDEFDEDEFMRQMEEKDDSMQQAEPVAMQYEPEKVEIPTQDSFSDMSKETVEIEDSEEDFVPDSEQVNPDEEMKGFQAEVTKRLSPVTKKFNLANATYIRKPVRFSATSINGNRKSAMSWALPNTKMHIEMRPFTGREIEELLNEQTGTSAVETAKKKFGMIYDHIVSDKAKNLETFLKTVSFSDIDHLYFAIYGANFADSNYFPYDCPKCKRTHMSNNIPLDKMYKFKNAEVEEEFKQLIKGQGTIKPGTYASIVQAVSDNIAIVFREPSIWNMVFEMAMLDEKFVEKYKNVLTIMAFIEEIDIIGGTEDAPTLSPIAYSQDPNNEINTFKSRIITYAKVLENLSSDSYNMIAAIVAEINKSSDVVTYCFPEITCSECHEVIKEQEMTAEAMVFTRAPLMALSLSTIK